MSISGRTGKEIMKRAKDINGHMYTGNTKPGVFEIEFY